MGKLFDAVRDGVTAEAAAHFYGLQFGRNGRAVCPWHDDHSPDLAFYDGGARCYCHACHGGGIRLLWLPSCSIFPRSTRRASSMRTFA